MLNSRLISCCSKQQTTVALSSIEAEYIVLTLISKKARRLKLLFTKLGLFYLTKQYVEIIVAKRSDRASKIKSSL